MFYFNRSFLRIKRLAGGSFGLDVVKSTADLLSFYVPIERLFDTIFNVKKVSGKRFNEQIACLSPNIFIQEL